MLPTTTMTVKMPRRLIRRTCGWLQSLPFRFRRASKAGPEAGEDPRADLWWAARALLDPAADTELLGLHALLRHSGRRDALDLVRVRFENRRARNPELNRRLEHTEDGLKALGQTDPTAHFTRLSGYEWHELPGSADMPFGQEAARNVALIERKGDRGPMSRRAVRPSVLAVIAVLFLVGLGSQRTDPLAAYIGQLTHSEAILFGNLGQTVRGHGQPFPDEASEALMEALERVEAARTSFLAFHTGYERDTLIQASRSLDRALAASTSDEELATAISALKACIDHLITMPRRRDCVKRPVAVFKRDDVFSGKSSGAHREPFLRPSISALDGHRPLFPLFVL